MGTLETGLTDITILLLIATVVAVVVKYIRLPYTVALVLVGLAVGFSHQIEALHLSREIILLIFLPPLLFEGTLNMDLSMLRQKGITVAILALVGTFVSTFLLGGIIHLLLGIGWLYALLLGAILSPTDPVSVLVTFKELGVNKGLSTIIEGESVFNDGIGVVLYIILIKILSGHHMTLSEGIYEFFWEVTIGAIIGWGLGYITYRILIHIDDHLIEVMISFILAYGVYIAAEHFHASGVIAVVLAGLVIGNYGSIFAMSPETRISLSHFWEIISFMINSILFLLIGIQLDSYQILDNGLSIGIVFISLIVVRSFIVYGLTALANVLKQEILPSWKHVINWGGLRGSIPIALALGFAPDMPDRMTYLSIVFGVVLLSVVIQGASLKYLLRYFGLTTGEKWKKEYELNLGRIMAVKAGLRELGKMYHDGQISTAIYERMNEMLLAQQHEVEEKLCELFASEQYLEDLRFKEVHKKILKVELTAVGEGFRRGLLSEESYSNLSRDLKTRIDA